MNTIAKSNAVYDQGYSPIGSSIATEVYKVLTENGEATRPRGKLNFSGPLDYDNPSVLSEVEKLTFMELGGDPPKLGYLPIYRSGDVQKFTMSFRDWWNKDVIYRASAAMPGSSPGMIPVNESPSVPYDKREKLTRLRLVQLLRNKVGSHLEADWPLLLDQIDDERAWGIATIQTPDRVLSTQDGTLKVEVRRLPAMMRQISHELVEAYGRGDGVSAT
ncbi:hypothetical protein [uncultured Sphingomonas sp.]|uniref:hypothetical protein n=1 Tax=uncultured Sphingomonas sp. TaxID=158754 RepID=UPI0025E90324|nr:hypothetical protein [uncultured Sphingomonas sp.]